MSNETYTISIIDGHLNIYDVIIFDQAKTYCDLFDPINKIYKFNTAFTNTIYELCSKKTPFLSDVINLINDLDCGLNVVLHSERIQFKK